MTAVTGTYPVHRIETRRLARTTGALSGFLIVLLGLWGALIPFVGPYFHYAFGSLQTWHYMSERLWLDILPGVVAVIGGLMLLLGSTRMSGLIGGALAVAAGAWFAVGPTLSLLWHGAGDPIGAPLGAHTRQVLELLGYFQGLGVVIAALAAFAMGRYFSRPRVVEEAAVATEPPVATEEEPVFWGATGAEPEAAGDEQPLAAREEQSAASQEPVAPAAQESVAPAAEDKRAERATPVGR
jgi:hypothetical protein